MFFIVDRVTGERRVSTEFASEDDAANAFGGVTALNDFCSEECCMLEWQDDEITGEYEKLVIGEAQ